MEIEELFLIAAWFLVEGSITGLNIQFR